jgi:hypothetical protein
LVGEPLVKVKSPSQIDLGDDEEPSMLSEVAELALGVRFA